MASLTVRQLDDKLKRLLRLRAARQGRSMEDEIRVILRQAAEETGHEVLERFEPPARRARKNAPSVVSDTRRILLIIGGGIAAYKSLDLIRRLQDRGASVRCILTAAAQQFVTPLAAGALAGERAYTDLFDPQSEFDVGHIRLARDTDVVVVAPATADLMAKMAGGHADDLATAVLLATDKPVLLAPAMNPHMWAAKATQRNLAQLKADGVRIIGPNAGEMAERGEAGTGRMAEPLEIAAATEAMHAPQRSARRQTRAGHFRTDQRADRSGALHRQPLIGKTRSRHRRGCGGGRCGRGAGFRSGQPARSARCFGRAYRDRQARCWQRSRRRCRPMRRCSLPPSPTGVR